MQDRNDNWIDFKVKETEINNFEIGDEIMLQGRNDSLTIDGIVESIRRKADFATQKATSEREDVDIIAFNVKVRTNNEKIYPGMRFKLIRNVELGMINVERKTLILLIFIPILYTSKLVIENNSFGAVVIPKNYSKEINGTGSTSIELIIDNTNRSVGGTVAKAVQSVLSNQNTNFNLSLRTLYNPTGGYIDFFLAALIMHSTQIAIVFALLQIFFRRAKK